MHPLPASTSSSIFLRRDFSGVFCLLWLVVIAVLRRAYGVWELLYGGPPSVLWVSFIFLLSAVVEPSSYVLFSTAIVFETEGYVMGRRPKVAESSVDLPKMRPALTPEAREGQMISLAMDLVEQRLRNGTASSQETTHFLRLATVKEQVERRLAEKELELKEAKRQQIQSQARIEELYSNALKAMQRYSGHDEDEFVDEY